MCGRFTLRTAPGEVARQFDLLEPIGLPPRYNIAPTQMVPVVRQTAAGRQGALLRWGLVPAWANDLSIGNRMINARSETAASKPSFRTAMRKRRCLVLADGFYEWDPHTRPKQPYLFEVDGGRPFAFAGLWERWQRGDSPPVETCTILTTNANEQLAVLHDRMPVILPPEAIDLWLDPAIEQPGPLLPLLTANPAEHFSRRAVSTQLNNPKADRPDLLEPSS